MLQAYLFKYQISLHKNGDEIIEEYRILALVPIDPKIGPKKYWFSNTSLRFNYSFVIYHISQMWKKRKNNWVIWRVG